MGPNKNMPELSELNLKGVAKKLKEESVFLHNKVIAQIGDTVEALHNVMDGEIPQGTQTEITAIITKPNPTVKGCGKRIKLEGFEGEYNPKKFKKLTTIGCVLVL